ncbi:hypothetical protein RCL1_003700 [Eukaryota sp. TZLM3-RCL]
MSNLTDKDVSLAHFRKLSKDDVQVILENRDSTNPPPRKRKKLEDVLNEVLTDTRPPNCSQPWQCHYCNDIRLQAPKGYSNLVDHAKGHENWEETTREYLRGASVGASPITNFVKDFAFNVSAWLLWTIDRDLPFTEVNNAKTKEVVNLKKICYNTLVKYALLLTDALKISISTMLPAKFGIMFDGWCRDSSNTTYVGVYVLVTGHEPIFLSIEPFQYDEENEEIPDPHSVIFGAKGYLRILNRVLESYQKHSRDISFLLADNEPTTKAVATLLNVPFIGCGSHRLEIAIKKSSMRLNEL